MLISHLPVSCYVLQVICAKKSPFPVEVEAGKTYYWCTCGKSKNQVRGGSGFAYLSCNYAVLHFGTYSSFAPY